MELINSFLLQNFNTYLTGFIYTKDIMNHLNETENVPLYPSPVCDEAISDSRATVDQNTYTFPKKLAHTEDFSIDKVPIVVPPTTQRGIPHPYNGPESQLTYDKDRHPFTEACKYWCCLINWKRNNHFYSS